MNKRDVVVVACRFISIWMFIDAVFFISEFITQSTFLQLIQPYSDEGPFNLTAASSAIVMALLRFLFAFALWKFAHGISRFVLRVHEPHELDQYPTMLEWLSIGIALVGIYLLAESLDPILNIGYFFLSMAMQSISNNPNVVGGMRNSLVTDLTGRSIAALFQLAFALFLINRSRWLAFLLAKWQRWESVEKSS